jgi:glutamate-1-semialdehyde 2,1-aminomutase
MPNTEPPPLYTTGSRRLHDSALRVLPGGTSRAVHQTQPHPIYAQEGRGCVVTDVDGNRYLDFYNNASSLIHGHAHPGIVAAIEQQAHRGTAFSLPVEGQIGLAEALCERIESAEHVRFVNSGSEAVLLAIRAARAITGRPKIAKFEGLYHGCADAVEVSLEPDPTRSFRSAWTTVGRRLPTASPPTGPCSGRRWAAASRWGRWPDRGT